MPSSRRLSCSPRAVKYSAQSPASLFQPAFRQRWITDAFIANTLYIGCSTYLYICKHGEEEENTFKEAVRGPIWPPPKEKHSLSCKESRLSSPTAPCSGTPPSTFHQINKLTCLSRTSTTAIYRTQLAVRRVQAVLPAFDAPASRMPCNPRSRSPPGSRALLKTFLRPTLHQRKSGAHMNAKCISCSPRTPARNTPMVSRVSWTAACSTLRGLTVVVMLRHCDTNQRGII